MKTQPSTALLVTTAHADIDRVNVGIDREIARRARELGLDVTATCEAALLHAIEIHSEPFIRPDSVGVIRSFNPYADLFACISGRLRAN